MGLGKRAVKLAAAGALLLATACTAVYRDHGYFPPQEDLDSLVVGKDTRDSVLETVGPPSSTGVLDGGGWYYVRSRFRNYAYRAPEEVNREVLAITFTDAGTLENIERFGLKDGRVVVLSRRVTDSHIRNVGFLRQLFGNLGRFSADQLAE